MIRMHVLSNNGIIYINPQHIEVVYAAAATPNNCTIVLSTGKPDIVVSETTDQVVNAIKALVT